MSCLLGIAFVLPHPAAAAEPNDEILQATDVVAGQPVAGALETADDEDWYRVRLTGRQQVRFALTVTGPISDRCGKLSADILRADGSEIGAGDLDWYGLEDENYGRYTDVRWTTPPQGIDAYVAINRPDVSTGQQGPGCQYVLDVGPALAANLSPLPPPRPVVTTTEPNDSADEAFGPIRSDTRYSGTIETSNDHDRMYFYASPGRDISVTLMGSQCGPPSEPGRGSVSLVAEVDSRVEGGWSLLRLRASKVNIETGQFRVPAISTRVELDIDGAATCPWFLEISPPEALLASEQAARRSSPACRAARSQRARAARGVTSARRRLARARTKRGKTQARRILRSAKADLRDARRRVARTCPQ